MPIGEWVHAEVERLLGTFDGVEQYVELLLQNGKTPEQMATDLVPFFASLDAALSFSQRIQRFAFGDSHTSNAFTETQASMTAPSDFSHDRALLAQATDPQAAVHSATFSPPSGVEATASLAKGSSLSTMPASDQHEDAAFTQISEPSPTSEPEAAPKEDSASSFPSAATSAPETPIPSASVDAIPSAALPGTSAANAGLPPQPSAETTPVSAASTATTAEAPAPTSPASSSRPQIVPIIFTLDESESSPTSRASKAQPAPTEARSGSVIRLPAGPPRARGPTLAADLKARAARFGLPAATATAPPQQRTDDTGTSSAASRAVDTRLLPLPAPAPAATAFAPAALLQPPRPNTIMAPASAAAAAATAIMGRYSAMAVAQQQAAAAAAAASKQRMMAPGPGHDEVQMAIDPATGVLRRAVFVDAPPVSAVPVALVNVPALAVDHRGRPATVATVGAGQKHASMTSSRPDAALAAVAAADQSKKARTEPAEEEHGAHDGPIVVISSPSAAAPTTGGPNAGMVAGAMVGGMLVPGRKACRFGAACAKPGCAFSHAAPCRYGDSCHNLRCAFAHPGGRPSAALHADIPAARRAVPCRFGALCRNPHCTFAHPPQRGTPATASQVPSPQQSGTAHPLASKPVSSPTPMRAVPTPAPESAPVPTPAPAPAPAPASTSVPSPAAPTGYVSDAPRVVPVPTARGPSA